VFRTLLGYTGAVAATYVLGVAAASQHVIGHFESMSGASVGLSERIDWVLKDILGMLLPPIYPLAIAVMMLIAFAICGFVVRRLGGLRTLGFVLAGALGMVGLHLALNAAFEINSIAASRSLAGLLGQAIAGACGGLAYIALHPDSHGHSDRGSSALADDPSGAKV